MTCTATDLAIDLLRARARHISLSIGGKSNSFVARPCSGGSRPMAPDEEGVRIGFATSPGDIRSTALTTTAEIRRSLVVVRRTFSAHRRQARGGTADLESDDSQACPDGTPSVWCAISSAASHSGTSSFSEPAGSACSTTAQSFSRASERARSPTLAPGRSIATDAISCRRDSLRSSLRAAPVERQSASRQGPVRSSAHADHRAQTRAARPGNGRGSRGARAVAPRTQVGVALALGLISVRIATAGGCHVLGAGPLPIPGPSRPLRARPTLPPPLC